jgi:hypothetical protein
MGTVQLHAQSAWVDLARQHAIGDVQISRSGVKPVPVPRPTTSVGVRLPPDHAADPTGLDAQLVTAEGGITPARACRGHNAKDPVNFAVGEVALKLTGGDDQVRRQFHFAQELSVFEVHVELVLHVEMTYVSALDPPGGDGDGRWGEPGDAELADGSKRRHAEAYTARVDAARPAATAAAIRAAPAAVSPLPR